MDTKKKILVVVPCHNESEAIASVLNAFPKALLKHLDWDVEVLVIDNNSTDNTADIAREHGVRVELEKVKGKGHAVFKGWQNIPDDVDYVVMMDGDNTYEASEIIRMLEPLTSNFCDVVLGSRIQGKIEYGAMGSKSRLGNWLFSFLVRVFYQVNVTDVLTGYFAWKKEALDKLIPHISPNGFELEMDMITKMARLGISMYSVPITYNPRLGSSKLAHFSDGFKILQTFVKNMSWEPEFESDGKGPSKKLHLSHE